VRGRIVLRLDRGLGWTKPLLVAGCGVCGTELARHSDPAAAARAAGRRRCPACGTRVARRLPGTTSLSTDLALAGGARCSPAAHAGPAATTASPDPFALEGGEPCPQPGPGFGPARPPGGCM
jgi:hypothetical protein